MECCSSWAFAASSHMEQGRGKGKSSTTMHMGRGCDRTRACHTEINIFPGSYTDASATPRALRAAIRTFTATRRSRIASWCVRAGGLISFLRMLGTCASTLRGPPGNVNRTVFIVLTHVLTHCTTICLPACMHGTLKGGDECVAAGISGVLGTVAMLYWRARHGWPSPAALARIIYSVSTQG